MDQQQLPDFSKIMKIAQQVASQIEPPEELKSGKTLSEKQMSDVIGKITRSVSEVVKPDMFETTKTASKKNGKQKAPVNPEDSKICLDVSDPGPSAPKNKKRVVEIESESSDDNDPIAPRTKDMSFTLSVKLEELYTGTKKKLALRRQKIDSDGSYDEEKKKLSIKIEPGMIDEQVIRFNHMADEKQGYETGDVVVCLDVEEHPDFVRDGNNLLIERNISLSEAYSPVVYIKHLNGETFKIKGDRMDVFDDEDNLLKKVPGLGMPLLGEPGKYGDLFIRFNCLNNCVSPEDPATLIKLTELFPPLNSVPDDLDGVELTEKEFEMVTETDLELLDSDSDDDSDYSDGSYSGTDESD